MYAEIRKTAGKELLKLPTANKLLVTLAKASGFCTGQITVEWLISFKAVIHQHI